MNKWRRPRGIETTISITWDSKSKTGLPNATNYSRLAYCCRNPHRRARQQRVIKFFICPTVLWFELEHRPHKLFHRLARRVCRRLVVTRVRIGLDAGILIGKRLTSLGIDDRSQRLLFELARAYAL